MTTLQDLNVEAKKINSTEDLDALWYFEPDDIHAWENEKQIIFDPYTYPPEEDERNAVKNSDWKGDFFWPKQMKEWVDDYWKKHNEKTFKIQFKKADEMILDSSLKPRDKKALALWVKNINNNNRKEVDAGWMPFYKRKKDIWRNLPRKAKKGDSIHVFKLAPYYFKAWNKDMNSAGPEEYKVFKGYIKHNNGTEEIGNYPYEDLFLVGRIIRREVNGEDVNRVIIIVGAVDYQIYPWKTGGPDGAGGGGAMP